MIKNSKIATRGREDVGRHLDPLEYSPGTRPRKLMKVPALANAY